MLKHQSLPTLDSSIDSKRSSKSNNSTLNWKITQNLLLKGDSLGKTFIEQLTKIKIYSQKTAQNNYLLKFSYKNGQNMIPLPKKQQQRCMIQLVKLKLLKQTQIYPQNSKYINICQGTIFKKECFGKWQQNYMFISKGGLIISKNKYSKHCDMYIEDIKELWTRFQLIKDCNFIVFKVKKFLWKYQFAVPIQYAAKWIQAFCSLIKYQ